MADTINKIVGQQAFDEVEKLKDKLEGLYKSFEDITTATKTLEASLSSAKGLKDLTDSYVKISRETQKLSKLKSELALLEQKRRTELEKTNKLIQSTSIQQAKETDRQIDRAERLAKAEERRIKAEEKAMSGSTNIYEYNRKRLQELTTQLRSLEIQYQFTARGGKANADELKRQRDAIAPLEKEYRELTAVLDEVENRTGGSTRTRNQMLTETNMLLREMPNFAISAQTGILSLSNNLPMFFEAWEKTSLEIDTATNKAKGFKGAMKEFVGSLFSVQTALIVLVTLMVQYGDEILNVITRVSGIEKIQKNITTALKETNDSYAKQISLLTQLTSVFNSNIQNTRAQASVLREVQREFGGYFNEIQVGTKLTEEQTRSIKAQIDVLKEKSAQLAYSKVLEEQMNEVLDAQIDYLRGSIGFWEKAGHLVTEFFASFGIATPFLTATSDKIKEIEKGTLKLSETNRKNYNQLKESLKQEKLTIAEFEIKIERLLDLEKKEQEYATALNMTNSVMGRSRDIGIDLSNSMSKIEIALLKAQTAQKGFIKDSKEWLKASKDIKSYQREIEKVALYNEFLDKGYRNQQEMFLSEEYRARYAAIMKEDVNEFKTASTAKKESVWDINKAILEVRKSLAEINNDIKSAMLDEASVGFMDIVEDENKALDERLKNLDLYYKNEKEKILFEQEKELAIIEEGEIRKKALEAKLGRTISTEQDLQSLVREKKLNDEQKNFLAMTLTYNKQRERITEETNAKLENLEKGRADKTADTIKSDFDKRVDDYQVGLQAVTDAIRSGTNAQILELNKKRKEVGMTETQYYRELESIIKGEGAKVITAQLDFIEKYKQDLEILSNSEEYDNLSVEAKNSINNMLQFLINAYADATRRVQKDTSKYKGIGELIRGWFGKDSNGDFKTTQAEIDDMIGGVISSFQSMFSSLNQMWDNYYEQRQQETDEEEKRFDNYYNNEKYRIESSLESQEEKERMLKELDGQRLASEQALATKRKELARQQAHRDKQQALFNATIQTATGIMNIWGKGYNPIISAVMTAALMATMAAQMAVIQSAPIPAYEKGTPKQGHKGGVALVGEKRRELVITPDGQMFYTPSSPTLMNLPQGTHVLPNPDAMSNQAKMEAVSKLSKTRRNSGGFDVSLLSNDIKHLTSVVRNKQENYFDLKNGEIRKMVKKNNARINYIGRC